jgi:hypothetical protein
MAYQQPPPNYGGQPGGYQQQQQGYGNGKLYLIAILEKNKPTVNNTKIQKKLHPLLALVKLTHSWPVSSMPLTQMVQVNCLLMNFNVL